MVLLEVGTGCLSKSDMTCPPRHQHCAGQVHCQQAEERRAAGGKNSRGEKPWTPAEPPGGGTDGEGVRRREGWSWERCCRLPRHEVHRSPLRFEEAGAGRADQAGENGLGRSVTLSGKHYTGVCDRLGSFRAPHFFALLRVFYFQCTENDDTVEAGKEAAFTESSEAGIAKSLDFWGLGG